MNLKVVLRLMVYSYLRQIFTWRHQFITKFNINREKTEIILYTEKWIIRKDFLNNRKCKFSTSKFYKKAYNFITRWYDDLFNSLILIPSETKICFTCSRHLWEAQGWSEIRVRGKGDQLELIIFIILFRFMGQLTRTTAVAVNDD